MKKKRIIGIVLFSLLLIIGLFYENKILKITNYPIISDNLSNEFNNYKIIQISDYHNEESKILNKELILNIKKEKPNIIVITGDLIDANNPNFKIAIDFIKKIKNFAPIYFVSGNHEASISNYEDLKLKLKEQGVIVLDNEIAVIEKESSKINIIGISDPKIVHDDYVKDSNIINKNLESINYDNNLFSILLTHRPEVFNIYTEKNIDLVLAGHAHGGQFRIPFIGGVIAPNQGLLPKYTSGIFKENNTNMIVNRGIGNSIIPLRINNRPELVIITLKNN